MAEEKTNIEKSVYDSTIENIGKAGEFIQNTGKQLSKSDAGKFARKNPFPLFLIGLGAGLLAYELSGKKRKSVRDGKYIADYGENDISRSRKIATAVSTTLKSAGGKIGDTASSAYGSVSNAAGTALHSVGDAASSAYGSVSNAASDAYSSVSDFAGNAYEKTVDYKTQARDQYDHYLEEKPLAIGAVALAVGAAVGLAIPLTRHENELMGEYRQQLLDKAQTAVGEYVEKAKQFAVDAQKTISDEVNKSLTQETVH